MKFSLVLPREALSIPVMRRVLGDALSGLGVSDDCAADLLVAVSEACTNAVQHAAAASLFEVVASIDDGWCVLKVVDHGAGFDEPGSLAALGDAVAESGRGITIMRSLVDDVSFDSRPEAGTVVYLQKRLTWTDEALMRRLEGELMRAGG
jgi:serine/threonine-protein kinase RsbW